ncbi:NYN domain-containing protein [Luteolibacter sp. Populi]|uniref:NYN domain-containing protein n=1 Tax=Luteolibacter sp. Populi TaxID=3230487 RepID=UPI0034663BE8
MEIHQGGILKSTKDRLSSALHRAYSELMGFARNPPTALRDRSVMFIDGENILLRYEAMVAAGRRSSGIIKHSVGRYVWDEEIFSSPRECPYRICYYTAAAGDDDALETLRSEIAKLHFGGRSGTERFSEGTLTPFVFKKEVRRTKTKSVDINLTTDLLRTAYSGAVEHVIVLSGDGDYLPVYEEVMRRGVRVTVGAFSSGLNPLIPPRVDLFWDLDLEFFARLPT